MSISGRVNPLISDEKSLLNANPRAKSEKVVFSRTILVAFKKLKIDAFLVDFRKNDNYAQNGDKNDNYAQNRDFVTYPTCFFEARIEGELGGHISARSGVFFSTFRTVKILPERDYIASERSICSVLLLVKF